MRTFKGAAAAREKMGLGRSLRAWARVCFSRDGRGRQLPKFAAQQITFREERLLLCVGEQGTPGPWWQQSCPLAPALLHAMKLLRLPRPTGPEQSTVAEAAAEG